ncbi:uncharacterized protein LOC133880382 [Alnus glutinosa]|uniref:uncharacterized protein LOC133880382 n=1 Tax=Alnus glutinosa TaxID=3517 RepID=UPI002D776322|nr:uncharacterized protein LOC133880382 [Alnus glutinosa]
MMMCRYIPPPPMGLRQSLPLQHRHRHIAINRETISLEMKMDFARRLACPHLETWGLRDGLQVVIQLNNNGHAIRVGSEKLARFGALLVKIWGLCPMGYPNWRAVPDEKMDPMWEIVRRKLYFDISLPPEVVKKSHPGVGNEKEGA